MFKRVKRNLQNEKIKKIINLFKLEKIQLISKINTLELENQCLEEAIKEDLYISFINKLNEEKDYQRLKNENKKLKEKNKVLKNLLRGDM